MNVVQTSCSLGCLLILNYREQVSLAYVSMQGFAPLWHLINLWSAAVPYLTNEYQQVYAKVQQFKYLRSRFF